MKTETFDDKDAFMAALTGKKPRAKRGRSTRPDLPSAPAGQGDRIAQLGRIAMYHFWPRYRVGLGYDFWHCDGRTTQLCADYAAACIAAEQELRG